MRKTMMMNLHCLLRILKNSSRKWASNLNLVLHFLIRTKVKNLLKPLIFLTIRRGFNVGNVKAMDIFNSSVRTLVKRSPRPRHQLGVMRNHMRVRKSTIW